MLAEVDCEAGLVLEFGPGLGAELNSIAGSVMPGLEISLENPLWCGSHYRLLGQKDELC